jgi:membrane-bound lytic murein transglycosylase B
MRVVGSLAGAATLMGLVTPRALALALIAAALVALPQAAEAKSKPREHTHHSAPAAKSEFAKYVDAVWPDAKAAGVSRETFDAAFKGVIYDAKIVANTLVQAEFVRPVWDYLKSAVNPGRVERGQKKYAAERRWVDKANADFGVSPGVVMGVWGIETDFGAFAGGDSVIRALTSLAFAHYHEDYFRAELIAALQILEEGDISPRRMLGSWAGAMGQTQFMPSSFLKYAVDFDGGGKRDIWGDSADAIGSTANYLKEHGWKPGLPWGFEAALPDGFALTSEDSEKPAPFSSFAKRGVTRADGKPLPDSGEGQLMILAGLNGPVFLVTSNFLVIKSYNNSTSYALAVALLGDEILGGEGVSAPWPVKDRQLGEREVEELQKALTRLGFDVGDIDGRPGEALRSAVRKYQQKVGLPPDGYATPALLKRVKAEG